MCRYAACSPGAGAWRPGLFLHGAGVYAAPSVNACVAPVLRPPPVIIWRPGQTAVGMKLPRSGEAGSAFQ
jgi:hypothetical protein